MEVSIKHYGNSRMRPSKIITMTVDCGDAKITEDITNLQGYVKQSLIEELRNIADELEEQNKMLDEFKKTENL